MNTYDGNKGANMLANVLSKRIKKESDTPLSLDFGEIQPNGSLTTNTFPVPIPKGSYSVLSPLTVRDESVSVSQGDRVLVAWVQNEAVVVGIVSES